MAAEIINTISFGTQGAEELSATYETPIFSDTPTPPGEFTHGMIVPPEPDRGGGEFSIHPDGSALTIDGTYYIIGFYFNVAGTPNGDSRLLQFLPTSGSYVPVDGTQVRASFTSGDKVNVFLVSSDDTFTTNAWHLLELRWLPSQASSTSADGKFQVWVDGVEVIPEQTGVAMRRNPFIVFSGTDSDFDSNDTRYAGAYLIAGSTSADDRLGEFDILQYRTTKTGVTPDGQYNSPTTAGDDLDFGDWGNVSDSPINDGTLAAYRGNDAFSGGVIMPGPDGDSRITGTLLRYMKGGWRADRSGGSGTNHFTGFGVSDNPTSATQNVSLLAGTIDNYFDIDTTTSHTPLASELAFAGIGKSSGGRDFDLYEMWLSMIHIPPAGAPPSIPVGSLMMLGVGY